MAGALRAWLLLKLWDVADRPADFVIYRRGQPQLHRWHIIPMNRWFNVYLHHFMASDEDAALHDHPWANMSLILDGGYIEHTVRASDGKHILTPRVAGDVVFRRATQAHRVEMSAPGLSCWSLFITGPKVRTWGFHCPKGWVPWREFVDSRDSGKIGAGCP